MASSFPSILKAASAQKGNGKLGIALVGLGSYSAGQLAPALQQTEHCYLAGIVTGTPEKEQDWAKKYNIPFRKDLIVELSEFITKGAYERTMELLKSEDRPTAFVVTDDVMAFGVMDAIKESGLRIPEDIEIMSFNNVPSSELTNPSLTSVDIDAFSLGYEASKLIIEKIKGEADRDKVIVPTRIIYRESSRQL